MRNQLIDLRPVYRSLIAAVLAVLVLTGCAGNNEKSAEMQARFDAMERQQLLELESADEARKLAMRRPVKTPDQYELRENDKNKRYQQAVQAAQRRSANNARMDIAPSAAVEHSANSQDQWQAATISHPATGENSCAIKSAIMQIDNGTLETQVQLVATSGSIFLKTDASLDTLAPQAGLRVDQGRFYAIEKYINEVYGLVVEQYRELLVELALGETLTVSFRYKPQEQLDDHQFSLNLTGFAARLDTLNDCKITVPG